MILTQKINCSIGGCESRISCDVCGYSCKENDNEIKREAIEKLVQVNWITKRYEKKLRDIKWINKLFTGIEHLVWLKKQGCLVKAYSHQGSLVTKYSLSMTFKKGRKEHFYYTASNDLNELAFNASVYFDNFENRQLYEWRKEAFIEYLEKEYFKED